MLRNRMFGCLTEYVRASAGGDDRWTLLICSTVLVRCRKRHNAIKSDLFFQKYFTTDMFDRKHLGSHKNPN